jgi:peptidoglycan/xylan/chitin deacetylase (PgdA/CDA1 family)
MISASSTKSFSNTSLKRLTKRALASAGIVPLAFRNRSFILMFHHIGLADMPAAPFAELLDILGRWFHFGRMDDFLGPTSDDAWRREPTVYMTFDDGLRNNLTVAYPQLEKRSIPATFYVCPQLIDSNAWIWTHEMRARLGTLPIGAHERLSHDLFGSRLSSDDIVSRMKELTTPKRRSIEATIRLATPAFTPTDEHANAFDLMCWDDLTKVDGDLITIGSHSMTHAMLDSVTAEEAEYEIGASRTALETALDREVVHFCYPSGQYGNAAEAVVRKIYRTAVTTELGPLPSAGEINPYRLPRVAAYSDFGDMAWLLYRVATG